MNRGGTERLHANTCSMVIPPAESLLGNVIHHPAAATSTDIGGGRQRHSIVEIDRWLKTAPVFSLYIPELILITVVIGQQKASSPSDREINARSCRSTGTERC